MKIRNALILSFTFITFVSLLIVWMWTNNGTMILGHDTGYRIAIYDFFISLFYTWIPAFNVGQSYLPNSAVIPIHLPEFIASLISNNPHQTQQLVLMYWQIISFLPFFVSLIFIPPKYRRQSIIMIFIASLIYSINFFNLHGFSVIWRARFSIQFIVPILFFYLWYALGEGRLRIRNLLLVALLTSFFNGGGSPPLLGAPVLIWIITGLFGILLSKKKLFTLMLFIKTTFLLIFIVSLLSAYWLLPYISYAYSSYSTQLANLGGVENIVIWSDIISKNTSLLNLFRLQALSAWDFDSVYSFILPYLTNPVLILGGFGTVSLAISSFFYAKTRDQIKYVSVLTVLLLVGMLMSAGTHPPTGWIYSNLLQHIPGFAIFRTPLFKFGMIVHFTMSLLAGYTVQSFISRLKNPFTKYLAVATVVIFICLYHIPYFAGNFFDYNPPFTNRVHVPQYVFDTASWINNHRSPYGRVLMLPLSNDGADGYTWGYWSPDPLPQLLLNRPLVNTSNNPPQIIRDINTAFTKNDKEVFVQLLTLIGIDTILWREDFLGSDKKTTSDAYEVQKQSIIASPIFRELYRKGKWTVYGIEGVLPRFTVPTGYTSTAADVASTFLVAGNQLPRGVSFLTVTEPFTHISPIVVEASDTSCTPQFLMNNEQVFIPTETILPTSIFYPLVKYREAKQINSITIPYRRNLYIAGKRLYEITELTKRGLTPRTKILLLSLIYQSEKDFKELEQNMPDNSTLSDKDVFFIKQHLITFNKMLLEVEQTHGSIPGIQPLYTQIATLILAISEFESCTTIPTTRTYQVSLTQDGNYSVDVIGNTIPYEIHIDGQLIQQYLKYPIKKGEHLITITYSNNAFERTLEDREIIVNYGSSSILQLVESGFLPNRISFKYNVREGIAPNVTISSDETEITKFTTGVWQDFLKILPAKQINFPLDMEFTLCCYQKMASIINVQNISLINTVFPKVYLVQEPTTSITTHEPKITYRRDNPTRYRVHIEDATKEFYLQFNEQYDLSWRASIVKSIRQPSTRNIVNDTQFQNVVELKPIDRFFDLTYLDSRQEIIPDHTIANDYANMWRVNKTGTFDIIIDFTPQRLTEIGMFLTILSLSIVVFTLIRSNRII